MTDQHMDMSTPGRKFPPPRQLEDNWGMLIDLMAPAAQPLKESASAGERAKTTYPAADSVSFRVLTWKFQP
jgi:hypothetical protein